jgi:hypothetical protein
MNPSTPLHTLDVKDSTANTLIVDDDMARASVRAWAASLLRHVEMPGAPTQQELLLSSSHARGGERKKVTVVAREVKARRRDIALKSKRANRNKRK